MNPQQPNDSDRREKLRRIVTRNGMSGRIPELLEAELDALEVLIQDEILKARKDENMQTRIIAKLAYVQGGKLVDTAKLIELLDEREAELSNQLKTKEER